MLEGLHYRCLQAYITAPKQSQKRQDVLADVLRQTDAERAHRLQTFCCNFRKQAPPDCKCAMLSLSNFVMAPACHVDAVCHDPICKCCTHPNLLAMPPGWSRRRDSAETGSCTLVEQSEAS